MKGLVRAVARLSALVVAMTTLFGLGSAAAAAVTKRRIDTTQDPTSNEPTATSVFAGERFESHAPALRRGRVITWFAGHDVDLRGATIDASGATLEVRTMYGGTQIAIPAGWRVESQVRSIFGGTEVTVDGAELPADAPVLRLHGFSLFGGVRVTTAPDTSWSGQDLDGEALPPAAGTEPAGVGDAVPVAQDGSEAVGEAPVVGASTSAPAAEASTAGAPISA
jgi:hypothetical protein